MSNSYSSFVRWLVRPSIYDNMLDNLSNRIAINLAVLVGFVAMVYFFMDILLNHGRIWIPLVILEIGFIVGVALYRLNRIFMAKVLVLLLFNLAIFIIVSAGPRDTFSSLHYLALMIGAVVVFEYKHLPVIIFFVLVTYALYLITHFTDYSITPKLSYREETTEIFLVVNVIIFAIAAFLALLMYIRMIQSQNRAITKRNDELIRSNKELDYFLYSTSHDLRAPLTTILGLINLADNSEDKTEVHNYHDLMDSRLDKMDYFIRDVIEVIRNSRLPVQQEPINLKRMIESIIGEFDNPLGFNKVHWQNNIPENMDLTTDPKRVASVIRNLLSNSVKYTDPCKKDSYIKIDAEPNGKYLTLSVEDNGIGIPEDQLPLILNMFHRATEMSEGSGLGLYIASETLRKLHGEIQTESKMGDFTKVSIKIPKKEVLI